MYSVELKFTVGCLKSWFDRNHKVLEVKRIDKIIFVCDNPKKENINCCLCDFSLESRAKNKWRQHVFKAEYIFLENIYSAKEMFHMGIDNFEVYCEKLNKILDELSSFCASIESENLSNRKTEEQDNEIKTIVEKIRKIKTSKQDEGQATKEKAIAFLYQHAIKFLPTDKVKDIPISCKFL